MTSLTDNQPQVTEIVKNILKKDYNYDSTVCTKFENSSKYANVCHRTLCAHFIGRSLNVVSSRTRGISYSIRTAGANRIAS